MMETNEALLSVCELSELAPDHADTFLVWFYGQLNMRVQARMARSISRSQFDEVGLFGADFDDNDRLAWLQLNVPQHVAFLPEEFEKLVDEVVARSDELVGKAITSECPRSWWRAVVLAVDPGTGWWS